MNELIDLIESKKAGVSEQDINSTETILKVALPEQYKELFKLTNNAQVGEWTLFPIKDSKNIKRTWDDVVRQNIVIRDPRMPTELLSIGEDGTGDTVCFKNVDNVFANKIYIWYHETGKYEESASSLKEFIISYFEE
ncbi:SMI1/KNR4 family protein [Sporosarcina aquimarina]|uniref:SMI1/KNR4 family protein n=1 Tax=Sporosarcina aquimarina TaxID=114975 RepID=UPI00203A3FA6|nr:SMI1/KNR4 family protein [Sporosarcina aquimarina]MCM3758234.1 SMI1/KNR4 family protein [Sporosarcina aquimarina]